MSTKNSIPRVYSIFLILVFMLALAFSVLDFMPVHAAGILYTKPAASGTGDCSSWANACMLQTALTGVLSGDEIWVAAGTYKPTTGTDRSATFQLIGGVALYGGFAGTETARDQHNPAANVTILSGEIGIAGVNSDNSYHVVTNATDATLDGFTISAGNANGVNPNDRGGGMFNATSSPALNNITFSSNSAVFGGGIYNHSSSPTLANITFSSNSAVFGGGMYNDSSSPTLTNITFIGNSADDWGGGIGNYSSNPTLTNITFKGNSAQLGGGIGNFFNSSLQVRNTILWGNTAATAGTQIYNDSSTPVVSDSVVQDGYAGGTNINTTDPMLGALGNYGGFTPTIPLLPGSSAIGRGNDATCASTDQRGVARPQGAHCDTGAFEYDYTDIYYVKPVASGTENCQSWENACTLQNALTTAIIGDEIWAAAGTYKPTMGTDRLATFQLKSGVALYGGFAGSETGRDQRNPATNLTFLSGDIDNNDSQTPIITDLITVAGNTTNSYHVVTGATGATLDGFTITAGYANGPSDSTGGGMFNHGSAVLTNVTFTGNTATNDGGGMYNGKGGGESNLSLTNVTFNGNSAQMGGGLYNFAGGGELFWNNLTLTNVTFTGNSAQQGGGMYNTYSTCWRYCYPTYPVLTNVTFTGNSAQQGGGIYNQDNSPQIRNTIFWGNLASTAGAQIYGSSILSDSVVQGGYEGGTNIITADPMLGTLGNYGGYTQTIPLLPGSSAIDEGNDATCAATDQRGIVRPQGLHCDIGAYEYEYGSIYYVKSVAIGTGNCQGWDNACTLQTALTGARSGTEIWTAAGTYKATTGTDRLATFQLKNGVALYGGFAGSETRRDQRNPAANVTILSGEIGAAGNSDNSYHVVTGTTGATLDGFTITAGNANGANPNDRGGGMYNFSSSDPTLTNVTFSSSSAIYGGGMYNYFSSPALMNVTFSGNSADDWGGGMGNYFSSPALTNVTFSANSADDLGGGMGNYFSSPTLTNVTFSSNFAQWGGGIGNDYSSSPQIRNTILWGNTATTAGAQIYNDSSIPVVSDSVVQDGYAGGTNIITADPRLGTLGNYGGSTQTIPLLAGSSAIDAGNDATCAVTDQRGIARPQGAHCDIGAFELDNTAPIVHSIARVNPSPTNLISVTFTVTFSESVIGVGVADFSLTTTGVSGAFVTVVSGSGSVYTVTANTGSDNGTIRLDVPISAIIPDLAGNQLAGLPYTSGETYTIAKVFTTIFLPLILR